MSFNKVIMLGNLVRTPELRTTPSGTHVSEVTLAVNDVYQKDGQKTERVTFVDVVVWGKQAETLCRWKKQGDPLLVEGRLQQDKWTDKQTGQQRSKLKVACVSFTFVARAGGDNGPRETGRSSGAGGYDGPGGYDDYATSLPNTEEPPF